MNLHDYENEEYFYLISDKKSFDIADADCPYMGATVPVIGIMTNTMRRILLLHRKLITDEIEAIKEKKGQLVIKGMVVKADDVSMTFNLPGIFEMVEKAHRISQSDLEVFLKYFDYKECFRPIDDMMELFHHHPDEVYFYKELDVEETKVCTIRGNLQRRLDEEKV